MPISPVKVLEDFRDLLQSMEGQAPVFANMGLDKVFTRAEKEGKKFLVLFKKSIEPIQDAAKTVGAAFVLQELSEDHKKLVAPVYDPKETKYMGTAGELLGEVNLLLGRLAQAGANGEQEASSGTDKTLYWLLGGLGVLALIGLGVGFWQARQERLEGMMAGPEVGEDGDGTLELSESGSDGSFEWQGAPGVALVGPGRS